ncbi:hypothetical protein XA68_14363 [Ophiocordyceps unilateralis]|uniref:Uncharacterized protein n=1 Tax=Ophiocordyceps unilateralis TaxID=268505 RepID=A0A2A9P9F7_OPHUN|nr:hypothetical protein XA68_14363 [Ophiocordyceps unilateralis]
MQLLLHLVIYCSVRPRSSSAGNPPRCRRVPPSNSTDGRSSDDDDDQSAQQREPLNLRTCLVPGAGRRQTEIRSGSLDAALRTYVAADDDDDQDDAPTTKLNLLNLLTTTSTTLSMPIMMPELRRIRNL